MVRGAHENMQFKENRLQTFENGTYQGKSKQKRYWTHDVPTPEVLADHGFFFAPTKINIDQVQCFACHKKETNVGGISNMAAFHLENHPDCPFSSIVAQQIEHLSCELPSSYFWREEVPDNFQDPTTKESISIRKKTFGSYWKFDKSKKTGAIATSDALAKAGFYYCPLRVGNDRVQCVYCNCSLDTWSANDNPIEEHKLNCSDYCYFLECINNNGKAPKRTTGKNAFRYKQIHQHERIKPVDSQEIIPPRRDLRNAPPIINRTDSELSEGEGVNNLDDLDLHLDYELDMDNNHMEKILSSTPEKSKNKSSIVSEFEPNKVSDVTGSNHELKQDSKKDDDVDDDSVINMELEFDISSRDKDEDLEAIEDNFDSINPPIKHEIQSANESSEHTKNNSNSDSNNNSLIGSKYKSNGNTTESFENKLSKKISDGTSLFSDSFPESSDISDNDDDDDDYEDFKDSSYSDNMSELDVSSQDISDNEKENLATSKNSKKRKQSKLETNKTVKTGKSKDKSFNNISFDEERFKNVLLSPKKFKKIKIQRSQSPIAQEISNQDIGDYREENLAFLESQIKKKLIKTPDMKIESDKINFNDPLIEPSSNQVNMNRELQMKSPEIGVENNKVKVNNTKNILDMSLSGDIFGSTEIKFDNGITSKNHSDLHLTDYQSTIQQDEEILDDESSDHSVKYVDATNLSKSNNHSNTNQIENETEMVHDSSDLEISEEVDDGPEIDTTLEKSISEEIIQESDLHTNQKSQHYQISDHEDSIIQDSEDQDEIIKSKIENTNKFDSILIDEIEEENDEQEGEQGEEVKEEVVEKEKDKVEAEESIEEVEAESASEPEPEEKEEEVAESSSKEEKEEEEESASEEEKEEEKESASEEVKEEEEESASEEEKEEEKEEEEKEEKEIEKTVGKEKTKLHRSDSKQSNINQVKNKPGNNFIKEKENKIEYEIENRGKHYMNHFEQSSPNEHSKRSGVKTDFEINNKKTYCYESQSEGSQIDIDNTPSKQSMNHKETVNIGRSSESNISKQSMELPNTSPIGQNSTYIETPEKYTNIRKSSNKNDDQGKKILEFSTPLKKDQIKDIQINGLRSPEEIPIIKQLKKNDISSSKEWEEASFSKLLDNLNNMETASEFLHTLASSKFELNDDYDGELTSFISNMPENEENMTLQQWIRSNAANSRKLLEQTCSEMVQKYKDECERAIKILENMPTAD